MESLCFGALEIPVHTLTAAVVGSGAAGWNAACHLAKLGVADIAVVTEGMNSGTSRNTGSDKQTYYKLSLAGDGPDSVQQLAETLFAGGSTDGDLALIDAASSAGSFLRLAGLGVPFPHNEYGEYAGYKTDHDPRQRATSAGPLTSRFMTEALEREAQSLGVPVFDDHQVIGIVTDGNGEGAACLGLLALNLRELDAPTRGLTLFRCGAVVWACGGEAGLFARSVYPPSQHGALGLALEAGAKAANLQEWQHGLASIGFRWNVSGTYQQALPRYVSTAADGSDEREFLLEYFTPAQALEYTFLKGYQWPFDARKLPGSSLIDLCVTRETDERGRRVFLDYRSNPTGLEEGFSLLSDEARGYLDNSGALLATPIDRLRHMNPDAIALYAGHGIDLDREPLEVAVCAQHMNGGLLVDRWWRTTVGGLYACGEAAGTFGAYRPGGSALNATQTGSQRAARHIATHKVTPADSERFAAAATALLARKAAPGLPSARLENEALAPLLATARQRMTHHGAHLRSPEGLAQALDACANDLAGYWQRVSPCAPLQWPEAHKGWSMLVSQFACLSAMAHYARQGGPSRGSSVLLADDGPPLPGLPWRVRPSGDAMDGQVLETALTLHDGVAHCTNTLRPVHPIPARDLWFENVWARYRAGEVND